LSIPISVPDVRINLRFFRTGGLPALGRERRLWFVPMAVLYLVAGGAQGDQLAFLAVVHRQSKIRPLFQMLYMVHRGCSGIMAQFLTPLTFVVIQFQHFCSFSKPFLGFVKEYLFAIGNELAKPCEVSAVHAHHHFSGIRKRPAFAWAL